GTPWHRRSGSGTPTSSSATPPGPTGPAPSSSPSSINTWSSDMDLSLTAEQVALQQAARDFVARHVTPHVREWDRSEEIDRSIIDRLGEAGFLGMTID